MSEGCCPGNGLDALELWGEAVNQYDSGRAFREEGCLNSLEGLVVVP